jgi:hypothetical protein
MRESRRAARVASGLAALLTAALLTGAITASSASAAAATTCVKATKFKLRGNAARYTGAYSDNECTVASPTKEGKFEKLADLTPGQAEELDSELTEVRSYLSEIESDLSIVEADLGEEEFAKGVFCDQLGRVLDEYAVEPREADEALRLITNEARCG